MAWQKIQERCSRCGATGEYVPHHAEEQPTPEKITCPDCEGKGYVPWGRLKVETEE